MTITVSEEISAPRERIWQLITDIDSWQSTIDSIKAIEIIDRPESGVVGLKWRETRIMFGKEAVETMWISAAEPEQWYETSAENHGAKYTTRVSISDANDKLALSMAFTVEPQTFGAKLMSFVGRAFNGTMRKMLHKDLVDIRKAAEAAA